MSRELLNVNNTDTIKQSDDSTTIILSVRDDNEPKIFKAGDIAAVHIDTDSAHVKNIPARLIIGSNNVNINSADLVNLPAGKYSLELWVSQKDGPKTTIYPSSGSLALTIDKNADDLTDKTLTTLTLDDLRKDLHDDVDDAVKHIKVDPSMLDLSDYAKKSDIPTVPTISLDTDKRTLTINNQTINIPNSVDLSGYAKTADVPNVKYNSQTKTLTVDGVAVEIPSTIDLSDYYTKEQVEQQIKNNKTTVDLTGYVKREDLADLAKKQDVPTVALDTSKRTLTINGTAINIPDTVDLRNYATKAELPKVTLDVEKRKITVGDATLDVPGNVDLSNYYTKSEVDDKLANAASGGKVDLTGYVKTSQLDDYAKKQDVPSVWYDSNKKQLTINGVNVDLPDNVDLSDYVRKEDTADFAKKTDIPTVPTIALDTEKRTLTVNGNVINIPDSVDLSGYVKVDQLSDYARKSDIPAAPDLSQYAKKSDIKTVDLTPYLTKVDADAKYATKSEIPNLSGYALKSDIKTVDLTPYLKKTDADSTYATKAAVENIKSQKGDRGTMIYSTNAQLSSKNMNMSVSIAALNQSNAEPRIGDYLIANIDSTTAISEITKVDSSDVYISSSYVNLQGVAGPSGSNGHSIWVYQGSSSDISINASQLLNYQQYSMLQPEIGDLVVGSDGTISSITYSYGDPLVINTGSVLTTIKAQSNTATPTASTFDYSKYPSLPIVSQENLGHYLNLDSTKNYTLNVDDNTLNDGTNTTQKALKPGIYLLRDFQNHGYNLTIKSDQHYGLVYGNAVQLIVTPYMIFAVVVGPNSAETLCARTQWDHDSYGYYGVSNKWFVVGQESKGTN
ncbi:hypothetical protein [Limosilactobacillus reuteri]|uniref:hypothetical protein n=1 Tax=Limosilactobacillus reuteri TaxID=1598 RepID=UPI001159B5DA|nr:hypothetical protein [Limosilactobacillus reuteri]QDK48687.1 hypothetical protein DPH67_06150 [Limosilactobacillus reuteri]